MGLTFSLAIMTASANPSKETSSTAGLGSKSERAATNVILLTTDGLRWQELFRGMDADMATTENLVKNPERLLSQFNAETTEARRERLMPFFWSHVASTGVIYGNRDKGSVARVTNNHWFSYPGYNEFLTGFTDDERIKTNNKIPNPHSTVFEWLAHTPGYKGNVVAFGAWDVFPYIFNTSRCGFPVDGGNRPFRPAVGATPTMEIINDIRETTPLRWTEVATFDSLVFPMAREYMKAHKPKAVYIGLGETDEWGHEGNYENYLVAAHRVDNWLRDLWELTQSMPEYRDKTTFIFTCDHGRGDKDTGPKAWNSHSRSIVGSDAVFMAVWGPDTPALGEIQSGEVTLSQVAATVADALGYDYPAAQPKAAQPLTGAFTSVDDRATTAQADAGSTTAQRVE